MNRRMNVESLASRAGAAISPCEWRLRLDLAACYRLCTLYGWDDVIHTHISAPVPGEPGHFLINPFGYRFDEICASNLVKVDAQGAVVGSGQARVNVATFALHAAIHAARPDAGCVMHLHNVNAIAVGIQEHGLLPLSQHALRFYGQLGYHDYEGIAFTAQEQSRLVARLRKRPAMLLRNHGSLVCGRSVAEAFVLMETLDKACAIQLQAQASRGQLHMPSPDVCRQAQLELAEGDGGTLEWAALLRKLDAIDGTYRS